MELEGSASNMKRFLRDNIPAKVFFFSSNFISVKSQEREIIIYRFYFISRAIVVIATRVRGHVRGEWYTCVPLKSIIFFILKENVRKF